jgi:hypothetical protein
VTLWRPMSEHVFPWPHKTLVVAAFARDDEGVIDVFCVDVAEHGALFVNDRAILSLHEQGWIPFAWHIDDTPERNDTLFPPLWDDYLTRAAR